MPYYRVTGEIPRKRHVRFRRPDEAIYLRAGAARFESVYGCLEAGQGDYVVVPRGTIHRWISTGAEALVIEARGHIRPPRRYLSQFGQFLEHAPYSERDLRCPDG